VLAELDDAGVVGFATIGRDGSLAAVAAEHERLGIGLRPLAWTESRERERGVRPHRQRVAPANARAGALLGAAG
jgi:hypothetical protein